MQMCTTLTADSWLRWGASPKPVLNSSARKSSIRSPYWFKQTQESSHTLAGSTTRPFRSCRRSRKLTRNFPCLIGGSVSATNRRACTKKPLTNCRKALRSRGGEEPIVLLLSLTHTASLVRSEERRVGKECRVRMARFHYKKKHIRIYVSHRDEYHTTNF